MSSYKGCGGEEYNGEKLQQKYHSLREGDDLVPSLVLVSLDSPEFMTICQRMVQWENPICANCSSW